MPWQPDATSVEMMVAWQSLNIRILKMKEREWKTSQMKARLFIKGNLKQMIKTTEYKN